jgi:hypothetical protein
MDILILTSLLVLGISTFPSIQNFYFFGRVSGRLAMIPLWFFDEGHPLQRLVNGMVTMAARGFP